MIITIQASLSNEQALILAKEKGYFETVFSVTDTTTSPPLVEEIPNPESSFEFLKRVYEAMIISDATKNFLEVENRLLREQQLVTEQTIRDNVIASVTSYVE